MLRMTWNWLYENWGRISLFTAVYAAIPLFFIHPTTSLIVYLLWLQTPLYMLHQYEEHANRGFQRFVNQEVFKTGKEDVPLNASAIFWINIPVIWVFYPLFSLLSIWDIRLGTWIIYMTLLNSISHIVMGIVKVKYNPGLLMSLFVNLPLSIITLIFEANRQMLGLVTNTVSIAIAVLLHVAIIALARYRLLRLRTLR